MPRQPPPDRMIMECNLRALGDVMAAAAGAFRHCLRVSSLSAARRRNLPTSAASKLPKGLLEGVERGRT